MISKVIAADGAAVVPHLFLVCTCVQTVKLKLNVHTLMSFLLLCTMYDLIFCGTAGQTPEHMSLLDFKVNLILV